MRFQENICNLSTSGELTCVHRLNAQMPASSFFGRRINCGEKPHSLTSLYTLVIGWFIRSCTCVSLRVCVCVCVFWGRMCGFYTPTYSKQQSVSLHKTFESSSGFDENFPTSEYPHLPALRCVLFLLSLSLSLGNWFLHSSQCSNPEICVVLCVLNDASTGIYYLNSKWNSILRTSGFFFSIETWC